MGKVDSRVAKGEGVYIWWVLAVWDERSGAGTA